MNRIYWIDWAKCLAAMTVVFCHLPQADDWMYIRYLQACIITVFFFLSGYLKRDRGSTGENWRKYFWGLVVPYVVYNALMLPYWVVRYYLRQGGWPDAAALAKPIVGALLLEHTSSFAEPLNGTLWYLPAILAMHLTVDLCRRTRHEHLWLTGICAASVIGHILYRQYEPHPSMVAMGFIRRLPYYYLGYVMGRARLLQTSVGAWRSAVACVGCIVGSVWLFYWHVAVRSELVPHLLLFYPVNILFMLGIIHGCQLLQGRTPQWVVNVSAGTLIIIGLQWMVIGTVNYVIMLLLGLDTTIVYTWYEAVALAVAITAFHYPLILLTKRHAPALFGWKSRHP